MGPLCLSLDATAVPDHPTGAGRYVLELAPRLSRAQGVELTVLCRRDDRRRWEERCHATVIDQAPLARPVRLVWEQIELPRLLDQLQPGVHHGPHYTMPSRARAPKVVTIHDMTFFDHPEWHERAKVLFFRRAIRQAAARADALVTPSTAAAERIRAILSPAAQLHLIPHGVDLDRFRPLGREETDAAAGDEKARSRLKIRAPYVAFVGTLEPRKDVPNLVRAFDAVAATLPHLSLVLAGAPGWGMEAIEAAIASSAHRSRAPNPTTAASASTTTTPVRRVAERRMMSMSQGSLSEGRRLRGSLSRRSPLPPRRGAGRGA